MTQFADRSPRPAWRLGSGRRLSDTVRDELSALRGRSLGVCAECGQPVHFAHAFTRSHGRVVHVRCPISASAPSPMGSLMPPRPPARDPNRRPVRERYDLLGLTSIRKPGQPT